MDNKNKNLQAFQDALQQHNEQVRMLQLVVKRVLAAKKDSPDQALINQLETFTDDMENVQRKLSAAKKEVDPNSSEPDEAEAGNTSGKKQNGSVKRLPNPEDQENAYQLKAIMMPQIYSQSRSLQAELTLFNRRNDLRNQRKERQVSYNRETNLSVATTLHILNMHEKKAKEAEKRAELLQAELDQINGQGESTLNKTKQTSGGDRPQSHLQQRQVDEILKKNQILIDETRDQRREIQRLKRDNADLTLKVKHASSDRDQAMSQLNTSEMSRKDLYLRFQRQKTQHDRLSRSLTLQSAEWIEARKQRDQEEEEYRWQQVGHAAPHGAHGRLFSHRQPRNVDQPRNMYPVKAYAQPTAA